MEIFTSKPELIAAFLSAIAAFFSALAAWIGPKEAAKVAEELREKSELETERRRTKLNIFGTLMEERADISAPDAVKALNLIDIAFYNSRDVRDAWSNLYDGLTNGGTLPVHEMNRRYRFLLACMAKELNLDENLRAADFDRIYFPNSVLEEREARRLQRQDIMRRFDPKLNKKSDDEKDRIQLSGSFPPPPKAESL